MNGKRGIIIFDGYCNFCSRSVLFIIKRDSQGRFVFAASQGEEGQKLLAERGIQELAAHSIILLDRDRIYDRSGAALRIAAYRYRLFGTRSQCFVPTDKIKNRFIDFPPSP